MGGEMTDRRVWALWVMPACATLGCGGTGSSYSLTVGDEDGGRSMFQPGDQGDAGGSSIAVSVTPAKAVVCPGQCAALTPHASGGHTPYSFQWDHGLSANAGVVTACPGATTTYVVTATDSSGHAGELESPDATGTAKVTVTVAAECSESGAPVVDAGPEGDAGTGLLLDQACFAPFTGITVGIAQGGTVYWADWTIANPTTVTGLLSPPSGTIQVTFNGGDLYGAQTSVGSNYWTPPSTYVSATVANAPPGPALIELNGGGSQPDALRFSSPVTNPLLAVVSLGNGPVGSCTLGIGAPFTILSSGIGYQGSGLGSGVLTATDGGLTGAEGNGVIQVAGTF
jgi:hypothetical protein